MAGRAQQLEVERVVQQPRIAVVRRDMVHVVTSHDELLRGTATALGASRAIEARATETRSLDAGATDGVDEPLPKLLPASAIAHRRRRAARPAAAVRWARFGLPAMTRLRHRLRH